MTGLNLISDAWLPARRASGVLCRLRPADLTDQYSSDPVLSLDFPRADLNAAVTEWLIGLVHTTWPAKGLAHWAETFRGPPAPDTLARAMASVSEGFELAGDGPRAFQDFAPLEGELRPISSLLIDAPGENTVRRNADLFVRRGAPHSLSLPMAAAALITFQTYAPSGGSGHRTSMRGGGPLTTLLAPVHEPTPTTLWELVWSNLPDAGPIDTCPPPEAFLPWLSMTAPSQAGQIVGPADAPPALAFFACPRRIRLNITLGDCAWSGVSGPVASGFWMRPHGANYKGWIHPLSPYRRDAAGKLSAVHPQSETFDVGAFPAWWGLEGLPSVAVGLWQHRRSALSEAVAGEIEVFGYDMDNMKARRWLARRIPWAPLYDARQAELRPAIACGAAGMQAAARSVIHALRLGAFGQRSTGGYSVATGLPGDAYRAVGQSLREACEPAFIELVRRLSDAAGIDPPRGVSSDAWRQVLRGAAFRSFDRATDFEAELSGRPHRAVAARKMLTAALGDDGAVARALDDQATIR